MENFLGLNLIRVFGFYLAVVFLIGLARRMSLYVSAVRMVRRFPKRYPRLLDLILGYKILFLTWATFRPLAVALLITVVYMVTSRVIFPRADVTVAEVLADWRLWPMLGVPAAAVLAVDVYGLMQVSKLDPGAVEKQLDEAEYWMTNWRSDALRIVTLGWFDPREKVKDEIHKTLLWSRDVLHYSLWWMSLQLGLRVFFGLVLWLLWAFYPGLRA